MNSEQIKRLSTLSRVSVSPSELASMTEDITTILGFIDTVQSVSLEGHSETATDRINVFREDTIAPLTSEHDLVSAAPLHHDHFVKVPKVIE
jgi:aspartyl-tRNA(Asn)/glutamyl-tRNA(Gln) amidotransferase subunit C